MKSFADYMERYGRRVYISAFTTLMVTAMIITMAMGQGIPLSGQCIDSTHLRVYTTLNISGVDIPVSVDTTYCPYGCMANSTQYGDQCKPIETENVNYNFILFFIGMAGAGLMWTFKRDGMHILRLPAGVIVLGLGGWLAYTTMTIIGVVFVPIGIVAIIVSIEDMMHRTG